MRPWRPIASALVAGVCASCASLTPERVATACRPIDLALETPLDTLRADARAGRALSQYALSLLTRYGLRGVAADEAQADQLRKAALKARGFRPFTSYLAGVNGRPGRVVSVALPQYDLTGLDDLLSRECVGLLRATEVDVTMRASIAKGACGGPARYERLRSEWTSAAGAGQASVSA